MGAHSQYTILGSTRMYIHMCELVVNPPPPLAGPKGSVRHTHKAAHKYAQKAAHLACRDLLLCVCSHLSACHAEGVCFSA